mmetsp:Transcript_49153/g.131564  ORF Transcript_49153/g.131564 Transcript_49153/m.131564 type:complete len:257 (-) Transcript_49153:1393-2163(-)
MVAFAPRPGRRPLARGGTEDSTARGAHGIGGRGRPLHARQPEGGASCWRDALLPHPGGALGGPADAAPCHGPQRGEHLRALELARGGGGRGRLHLQAQGPRQVPAARKEARLDGDRPPGAVHLRGVGVRRPALVAPPLQGHEGPHQRHEVPGEGGPILGEPSAPGAGGAAGGGRRGRGGPAGERVWTLWRCEHICRRPPVLGSLARVGKATLGPQRAAHDHGHGPGDSTRQGLDSGRLRGREHGRLGPTSEAALVA